MNGLVSSGAEIKSLYTSNIQDNMCPHFSNGPEIIKIIKNNKLKFL